VVCSVCEYVVVHILWWCFQVIWCRRSI